MAAIVNRSRSPGGQRQFVGGHNAIITDASTTNVIKASGGFIGKLLVSVPGTGWVIDIYDDPSTTNNPVWTYATADGKVALDLEIPCQSGITVVTNGGTPGRACLIWD